MANVGTYLYFPGNTEAAFNFYKSIFGGDFINGIARFGDIPMAAGMPSFSEAEKQMVLHIALPILGGHKLLGTDAPGSLGFNVQAGNQIYINLEPDTRAETERLFEALTKDGCIKQPLCDVFRGAYYGSGKDRFGILWMFNCSEKA